MLVSVCIPTYNRSNSLKRAVERLLSQSFSEIEILISDNCSTDDTASFCKNLIIEKKNVKYFRQPYNIGPTANFEYIKKMASGKYFMWHSDDDYLETNFIEKCVLELEKNEDLILVSGLTGFKKKELNEISHFGNSIKLDFNSKIFRIANYLYNVQDNSIFCGIYRLKKVDKLSMPNLLAGDWIWLTQVLFLGKAKVLNDTKIIRDYGDSTSSSYEKIVVTISAPKWNIKYPNVAIVFNFFQFFLKSNLWILNFALFTLIIKFLRGQLVIIVKLILKKLMIKLPFK